MSAFTAKSDNSVFLFFHYDKLDSELRVQMDELLRQIGQAINSTELEASIKDTFSSIFSLRMKAVRVLSEMDLEYSGGLYDSMEYFEQMSQDPKLGLLGENALFAIRSNIAIAERIFAKEGGIVSWKEFTESMNPMPLITYEGLVQLLSIAPQAFSGPFIEWMNASMKTEFGLLAATLISEGKIFASSEKIEELCFTISAATQDYNAIAIEVGILKLPDYHSEPDLSIHGLSADYLSEQQKLADSDLLGTPKNFFE